MCRVEICVFFTLHEPRGLVVPGASTASVAAAALRLGLMTMTGRWSRWLAGCLFNGLVAMLWLPSVPRWQIAGEGNTVKHQAHGHHSSRGCVFVAKASPPSAVLLLLLCITRGLDGVATRKDATKEIYSCVVW